MAERVVVGVDLGGTNVRAAAIDESGQFVGTRYERPSRAQEGTEAIFDSLHGVVRDAVSACPTQPVGIGIAIPGHIDDEAGRVVWAPNFGHLEGRVFRNWIDVPVRAPLVDAHRLPVSMGNDANLAALGEYRFGSGRNQARCLVMLTIGTGIGGGVVFGPTAVQGEARGPLVLVGGNKGGAELGHTILLHGGLDCNAGSYGALEAYCQRDSIVQRAIHKLRRGRESALNRMVGDLSDITPRVLSEACAQGDEVAIEVFAEVGAYLGVGIGTFINIFAPDIVAIGGSIAKAGEWLLAPASRAARDVAIPSLFRDATIVVAEQIDDAGILGAAALALERADD